MGIQEDGKVKSGHICCTSKMDTPPIISNDQHTHQHVAGLYGFIGKKMFMQQNILLTNRGNEFYLTLLYQDHFIY